MQKDLVYFAELFRTLAKDKEERAEFMVTDDYYKGFLMGEKLAYEQAAKWLEEELKKPVKL